MHKKFAAAAAFLALALFTACVGGQGAASAAQPQAVSTIAQSSAASPGDEAQAQPQGQNGGAMVIYFSATGNTEAVAGAIAESLGCPIMEIVPAEPYTAEDLDYNNSACRANAEMNDEAARPAIEGDLSAAENCSVIYLGYPIWWGTAPRIINTFLESYDLSGVQIYTFCTSGGSGVQRSVSDLQAAYPAYSIVSGQRFAASATGADVSAWLAELGAAADAA